MSRTQPATFAPLRLATSSSRLASAWQAADRRHFCPCTCIRLGASAAMARPGMPHLNPGALYEHLDVFNLRN